MITRKYIENYEHEVLIGIQFVLEVYMYRHDYEKKQKLTGPFLWTGLTYLQVLCHYWAVELLLILKIPKLLSHSSCILRIKKD